MRKSSVLILIVAGLILTACGKEKKEAPYQESRETSHQWTERNKMEFVMNCALFLEKEGVEDPSTYCDCLLQSSLSSYPDPEVAMELEQEHMAELFLNSKCLDDLLLIKIEDPWTEEVEQIFLKHCYEAQLISGASDDNAGTYCSCALEEIKTIIPNPQHVLALTEEELQHILGKCNP